MSLRESQVTRLVAARRTVGEELRHGTPVSLARAMAVLRAAERVATDEEIAAAIKQRRAELWGVAW